MQICEKSAENWQAIMKSKRWQWMEQKVMKTEKNEEAGFHENRSFVIHVVLGKVGVTWK